MLQYVGDEARRCMTGLGHLRRRSTSPAAELRFYRAGKLDRSRGRAAVHHHRYMLLKYRVYDAIGGAPHLERSEDRVRLPT